MKVAVVGAGICGSSAARYIAIRGHDVALFEQFSLGHDLGSSHGNSRIVRKAYPDPFYTECMAQAYPLWRELERQADRRLFYEVGLLYYGKANSPNVRSLARGLKDLEVDHESLAPRDSAKKLPNLHLEDDEIGIWTPDAGWVDAKAAVEANLSVLRSLGGVILPDYPVHWEQLERDFDTFVVCPGPWIRQFVPVPVRTSLQTFGYVASNRPQEGPVWIEDGPLGMYGFPTELDRIDFKVGVHELGRDVTESDLDRTPSEEHAEEIRRLALRRFGIKNAKLNLVKGCIYTSTIDEDFLLGRIGERGFFASACSGHGFKFGPWIGKLLAAFADGDDDPENYPRFFWDGSIAV